VIDQQDDAIRNFIDQASHRNIVDYGTVQTALNNSITAAAASAAQTATARTQLLGAADAKAKALVSSNGANQPAPQVQTAPASLDAAKHALIDLSAPVGAELTLVTQGLELAAPTPPPGGTPAQQNAGAVSALIAATEAALQAVPAPQYTTINTNITSCTAGLS
jgi:hypothetical protein